VAERKEEANRHRALAFLHELARNIVNGCDMIGINCMPETKAVR
jgi:hypothetical protein